MKDIFFVGMGGMLGSISRYLISKNIPGIISSFPLGIFFINIIGCFAAGIIYKFIILNKGYDSTLNLFLLIGFCGGFTTFSAFSIDAINLLNNNKIILMITYTLLSSVIGIFFCYLGMNIIK
tara:strand:+ start:62 stop:427 length:366 start_codon:yes stop_codon:yes gene_type:complete